MSIEPPTVEELISHSVANKDRFVEVVKDVDPDQMMMMYSELAIFASITENLGCTSIIESGRGRGVSTKFLASYFKDTEVDIISIDSPHSQKDNSKARKRLSDYENIDIRYGDSHDIIPDIIDEGFVDEKTCALIDGPKNDEAIELALKLFDAGVSFVGIHDLYENLFTRDITKIIFNERLYTDNNSLREEFRGYDEIYSKEDLPYRNTSGSLPQSSLGIFYNTSNSIDEKTREKYQRYLETRETYEENILDIIGKRLKEKSHNGAPVTRTLAKTILKVGNRLQNKLKSVIKS